MKMYIPPHRASIKNIVEQILTFLSLFNALCSSSGQGFLNTYLPPKIPQKLL